jgi:hypothetical protein
VKQNARKARPTTPESPDIELTADVRAKELRFDEVPETEVNPPAQTKRENLPEQVRPEHEGITFRDIRVRLRIANVLTVSEPDQWDELREGDAEGLGHRRDSSKPSQEAG